MLSTSAFRVFKMGFTNIRRNVWLSIVATTVLALTLITLSILGSLQILGDAAIKSVQQKVDLSIYLKVAAKPDDIDTIERTIKSYSGIKDVTYISQEDALKNFREKHKDNELILKSLTELDQNPLQPSFTVVAENPTLYKDIAAELSQDKFKATVQSVNYKDNKEIIDNLTHITNTIRTAGYTVSVVFILISILVSFNTVRLTIYTRKEEVEIMRLVGASNWFIRWPFIFEGVLYAIFATVTNLALLYPALVIASPSVNTLFKDTNLDLIAYAQQHWVALVGGQFLIALTIGVLSSFIAIRRYLKI